MYFYFQFLTVDPDTPSDGDDLRRNPSINNGHCQAMLEPPPLQSLTVNISKTRSLLISCHKQLSYKLHVKGGSNILVGSAFL
jgi:hypothetical protein